MEQKHRRVEKIADNWLLVIVMVAGISMFCLAWIRPVISFEFSFGSAIALISAGGVGVFMMLTTHDVARNLYSRMDLQTEKIEKQTGMLEKQTNILKEIATSQKDISETLKHIDTTLQKVDQNTRK